MRSYTAVPSRSRPETISPRNSAQVHTTKSAQAYAQACVYMRVCHKARSFSPPYGNGACRDPERLPHERRAAYSVRRSSLSGLEPVGLAPSGRLQFIPKFWDCQALFKKFFPIFWDFMFCTFYLIGVCATCTHYTRRKKSPKTSRI